MDELKQSHQRAQELVFMQQIWTVLQLLSRGKLLVSLAYLQIFLDKEEKVNLDIASSVTMFCKCERSF